MVGKHEVNAFQLHHDFGIFAEVGMDVTVDVLLLMEGSIVSGKEKQQTYGYQPDRPCDGFQESAYMYARIEAFEAISRV